MADRFSKEKRSYVMSRIRGRDSGPERKVRELLSRMGYSFSEYDRVKGIRIDIAIPRLKIAIMVDGCFWHGCPKCYREPKSNVDYWVTKIKRNRQRDRFQKASLADEGWKVVRIWEHELATKNRVRLMTKLRKSIPITSI